MDKQPAGDQVASFIKRLASWFDGIGFVWLIVAISVLLMVPVTMMNFAKLGAYFWFVSKLTGAAALGFGFDKVFFRGADPRYIQDGIEKSIAQQRRGWLIVGAMIAAGLIG